MSKKQDEPSEIKTGTFENPSTFVQYIDHFRKEMGEFDGFVFGYIIFNELNDMKIDRPMLFISEVGDNTEQQNNSRKLVITNGIEVSFALPKNFKNEHFNIPNDIRGENALNHFRSFRYRLMRTFFNFRPIPHNCSIVKIDNKKYAGSRYIGQNDHGVHFYNYNFTFDETLNLSRLQSSEENYLTVNWLINLQCENNDETTI